MMKNKWKYIIPGAVLIIVLPVVLVLILGSTEKPLRLEAGAATFDDLIDEEIIEEVSEVPFETQNEETSTLYDGQTSVKQEGSNGTRVIKYKVTYLMGKETSREVVEDSVTVQPVPKIVYLGTAPWPVAQAVSSGDAEDTAPEIETRTVTVVEGPSFEDFPN